MAGVCEHTLWAGSAASPCSTAVLQAPTPAITLPVPWTPFHQGSVQALWGLELKQCAGFLKKEDAVSYGSIYLRLLKEMTTNYRGQEIQVLSAVTSSGELTRKLPEGSLPDPTLTSGSSPRLTGAPGLLLSSFRSFHPCCCLAGSSPFRLQVDTTLRVPRLSISTSSQ